MNDFTKEELQDIYDAVMDTEIPILGYLPSKIQSMIDSYCEHEIEIDYSPYGLCKNCGAKI